MLSLTFAFSRGELFVESYAAVDHNKFCVSVHYRNCEQKEWGRVQAVVDECVAGDPERQGLSVVCNRHHT